MKDIIFKIWPEIVDYLPAMLPLPKTNNRGNNLFVDLSGCASFNVTGLNILLIGLIKTLQNNNKQNIVLNQSSNWVSKEFEKLNFFKILSQYTTAPSLFEPQLTEFHSKIQTSTNNIHLSWHFPIFTLEFKKFINRRDALKTLKNWLYNSLYDLWLKYDFNLVQFISVMTEIAKNSADHTTENAFMGMDVIFENSEIKIFFSFGDLGVGIKAHIENNLPNDFQKRKPHWSLYESYFYALQDGFTSKPLSKLNRGIGMSIILDGSKSIGLDLSVFDAQSRGTLSKINEKTHGELRKNFFNINREVGFYYFGILTAGKLK